MQTQTTPRRRERGYLMVGLLAMMTISLIVMASAVPQLKFESQREKEEEMLWRGQEIAQAIQQFRGARGQLPTTLEELVEGVNVGIKKQRLLRESALCDPMLPCTEGKSNWRLVHPFDPVITSMIASLQAYQQKVKDNPQLVNQLLQAINNLQAFAPRVQLPGQSNGSGGLSGGLGVTSPTDSQNPNGQNPNGQNPNGQDITNGQAGSALGGLQSDQKPIVGVVSHSKDHPVRQILDIEQYDQVLYGGGVLVIAGGFHSPYYLGATGGGTDPLGPCPNGLPRSERGVCPGTPTDLSKRPTLH